MKIEKTKNPKVDALIKKWNIRLAVRDGQKGIAVHGKPTAAQVAELRQFKPEIVAELKRREEEYLAAANAEAAAMKAARQEKIRAIKAGEKNIELRWHDGEYLSGWEALGEAGGLLMKLGLARHVNGWGYHVRREAVDALGEKFTYAQAIEYARPAREKAESEEAAEEAARQEKLEEARRTGEPVLLEKRTEPCDGSVVECSLDVVCRYAMPDGSVKVERHHTH